MKNLYWFGFLIQSCLLVFVVGTDLHSQFKNPSTWVPRCPAEIISLYSKKFTSSTSSYEDYSGLVDRKNKEQNTNSHFLSSETPSFPLEIENILIQLNTPSVLSEIKLLQFESSREFDYIKYQVEDTMEGGEKRKLITNDLGYKGCWAAALFRLLHQYLYCLEEALFPYGKEDLVSKIVNYKGNKAIPRQYLDDVITFIKELPPPHRRMLGTLLTIGISIREHQGDYMFYVFWYHLQYALFGRSLKDLQMNSFHHVMKELANELTTRPESDLAKSVIFNTNRK